MLPMSAESACIDAPDDRRPCVTDEEFIEAYHTALCRYDRAKSGRGDRVDAFVRFVSAERALAHHFGNDNFLQRYRDRHPETPIN